VDERAPSNAIKARALGAISGLSILGRSLRFDETGD